MTTTTGTVHYDLTGNFYYGVESSGFCGAAEGAFTVARSDISCPDCLARIS